MADSFWNERDAEYWHTNCRDYRIVRATNSWNIAGWGIEDYWPGCMVWANLGTFYFTRWGARRAMRAIVRG